MSCPYKDYSPTKLGGVSDSLMKAVTEKGAHTIDHGSKKSALKSLEKIVLFYFKIPLQKHINTTNESY